MNRAERNRKKMEGQQEILKGKAEGGDTGAQFEMGCMYMNGTWGSKQDCGEAYKWWHKAAEGGNEDAMISLGEGYYHGWGMPKDYEEAAKWYEKGAISRNKKAQFYLGEMYCKGESVPKYYGEAAILLSNAADYVEYAQWLLGILYYKGDGLPKDYVEARKRLHEGAESDYKIAQFYLGEMYCEGRGIEQDLVEAYKWFNLACISLKDASKARDKLEQEMSPEQIAEGQKLTREWVAKRDDERKMSCR